jgi:hypothetical protein
VTASKTVLRLLLLLHSRLLLLLLKRLARRSVLISSRCQRGVRLRQGPKPSAAAPAAVLPVACKARLVGLLVAR